jgi:cathepsin E
MFPTTWFIVVLISSFTVTGNIIRANRSPITFPLAKRVNLTSIHNLVRNDQARAKRLKAQGSSKASGLNVDAVIDSSADNLVFSYVATVGIGIPATDYSLIVDTGSSFIVIDTNNKPYVQTGTSVQGPNTISETFSSTSSFTGKEFFDTVTITPSLVVKDQAICVSNSSDGFESGVDGILGLGPVDLTLGALFPDSDSTVPTIVGNAFSQGLISADEISIAFQPTDVSSSVNGVLTWGGTNTTNVTGTISFTPITTVSPSNEFWGFNQSIHYGTTTILAQTAGIVDTGK